MKRFTLSQKLFKGYAIWFALCITFIAVTTGVFTAYLINADIETTYSQSINGIGAGIESYFNDMDEFSRELLTSEQFAKTAIEILPQAFDENQRQTEAFSDLYLAAKNMLYYGYKVGVLVQDTHYIWMSNTFGIDALSGEELDVYENLVRNEKPVILFTPENEYLSVVDAAAKDNGPYISLVRSIDSRNNYIDGRAILEVMVEYEDFKEYVDKLTAPSARNISVNIFSGGGESIYLEDSDFMLDAERLGETETYFSEDGKVVSIMPVFSDVYAVYTMDLVVYFERLIQIILIEIVLFVILIVGIMVITKNISRKMSSPINDICDKIKDIDIEKGIYYQSVDTDIAELSLLSETISGMCDELDYSMKRVIALKHFETQARLLALQAQIQPHFLYNTINTISSLADEDDKKGVKNVCENLTNMFRYIAVEDQSGVKLFEEIAHTERYAEIMKQRFPSSSVTIDVPLELYGCLVPKLTLQPLVENSFKYGKSNSVVIKVTGAILPDGRFSLSVSDNGPGFSSKKRDEILENCHQDTPENPQQYEQTDGIGLVNVYARLSLFYGEAALFEIEAGKGVVTVGGQRLE